MGDKFSIAAICNADQNKEYGLLSTGTSNIGSASALQDIMTAVEQQGTVHYFTDGAWSMHQLLMALIELSGNATVYIATYALSETAMRTINQLKAESYIQSLHCLIDNRVDTRTAGSLQLLKGTADRYALAPCHAKVTTIQGIERSFTVIGSANYTENKRLEAGIISAENEILLFHQQWINKAIEEHGANRGYT